MQHAADGRLWHWHWSPTGDRWFRVLGTRRTCKARGTEAACVTLAHAEDSANVREYGPRRDPAYTGAH